MDGDESTTPDDTFITGDLPSALVSEIAEISINPCLVWCPFKQGRRQEYSTLLCDFNRWNPLGKDSILLNCPILSKATSTFQMVNLLSQLRSMYLNGI